LPFQGRRFGRLLGYLACHLVAQLQIAAVAAAAAATAAAATITAGSTTTAACPARKLAKVGYG